MSLYGERYIDSGNRNWELFYQHMGRYLFAKSYAVGKVVLDAACGTGYGTVILAEKARKVVGVDNSKDAITYCIENYRNPNVHFMQMDCSQLGFSEGSFDTVVSFETLEHIPDMNMFLREIRGVLKPGGTLIISTPNRPLYAVYNKGNPNIYHYFELDEDEFRQILSKFFTIETIWGQRYFSRKDLSLIRPYAAHGAPTGPDGLIRRALRVGLRNCIPTSVRSSYLLNVQVWANKCRVGEIQPSHGVYMIAKAIK